MSYVKQYCVFSLKVLLLPFTKVLGQNYQSQKDFLHKSNKREVVVRFDIFDHKWSILASRKKVDLWVFANHPAVHSRGVSRGQVCGCGCWR